MSRMTSGIAVTSLAAIALLAGCGKKDPVQAAAKALGVESAHSIEFSGDGSWFQFGQAPAPTLAWPQFELSQYVADVNFDTASAQVQIVRKQVVEAGRERPTPVEQKPQQFIAGGTAWNVAVPNNSAPGTPATAAPQPAAVEERNAEIWSTPQGFVKAALANKATSKAVDGGTEVSFTVGGKYRYVGLINAKNEVASVQTWIDNPILGDTLVETTYSDYKDFDGFKFPAHLVRKQGGHPVLDLNVRSAKLNPAVEIAKPAELGEAKPITVTDNVIAEGVHYLTGGSHHSVAIEQADHVVVVEAPLDEARSLAVISKVHELIPGKPIKYLVNTHQHFDHSGGLRSYVDEGAIIVTNEANKSFYEQAWAQPHTLNPDKLSASKKEAQFETFTGEKELSDGKRKIAIHDIAGNGHNDAFDLVYLPAEQILIEADAYTPVNGAPPPATPNPYSVNLYDNVQKLGLKVQKIAALHGPGLVEFDSLKTVIGAK